MGKDPILVVLAAGMGSRYGGLKQMDGVGPSGETLLEYSIFDAIRSGFGKILFIIRHSIEADFRERVLSRLPQGVVYSLAFQEIEALPEGFSPKPGRSKPWGTAHALWCARKEIDAPFAVINADDFYGRKAFDSLHDWLTQNSHSRDCCMVGYALGRTLSEEGSVSRGVCQQDSNGWLTSIVEHTKITRVNNSIFDLSDERTPAKLHEETVVSMNCWGFNISFLPHLEKEIGTFFKEHHASEKTECYLPSVVETALLDGKMRCRVLRSDARWCGVTYPGDRPRVEQAIREMVNRGEYPSALW